MTCDPSLLSEYTKERIYIYVQKFEQELGDLMKRVQNCVMSEKLRNCKGRFIDLLGLECDSSKVLDSFQSDQFSIFFETFADIRKILEEMNGVAQIEKLKALCDAFDSFKRFWIEQGTKESIENGFRRGEWLELQEELSNVQEKEKELQEQYHKHQKDFPLVESGLANMQNEVKTKKEKLEAKRKQLDAIKARSLDLEKALHDIHELTNQLVEICEK